MQKHQKYLTSKNGIKTAQNPLFKELWAIFVKLYLLVYFWPKQNGPENAILATERAPLKKTIFLRKNSLYDSVFKKKRSAKSQITRVILQQKTNFFIN